MLFVTYATYTDELLSFNWLSSTKESLPVSKGFGPGLPSANFPKA